MKINNTMKSFVFKRVVEGEGEAGVNDRKMTKFFSFNIKFLHFYFVFHIVVMNGCVYNIKNSIKTIELRKKKYIFVIYSHVHNNENLNYFS